MNFRKPSYSLILLLLIAVVWLFTNATVNRHIHILSDGYVISHAHPFVDKEAGPGQSPETTHRHSEKELMLFSLFTGFVYTFIIILVLRSFLNAIPQFLRFQPLQQEPARNHFQVHHYHAPPLTG
ncbi:MAG: hypothetical protein ABFS28_13960 [Bacteroidota bacterium]